MKAFSVFVFCAVIYLSSAKNIPSDQDEISDSVRKSFITAVENGDVEGLREIFKDRDVNEVGGNHSRTALHYVCEYGNEQLVDFLIEKGANISIEDDEGFAPIHFAALNSNDKVMATLIKHGAEVNKASKDLNRPLHLAALNSDEKVIELLLINGADVSARNDDNETALLWAASNLNEKVADLLIKSGSDVNAQTKYATPLYRAAANSNENITELLIKAGANVNLVGFGGFKPVHAAVMNGQEVPRSGILDLHEEDKANQSYAKEKRFQTIYRHFAHPVQKYAGEKIIKILLNNGADINPKSGNGDTPYDFAMEFEDERLKEFLAKLGGKPSETHLEGNELDEQNELVKTNELSEPTAQNAQNESTEQVEQNEPVKINELSEPDAQNSQKETTEQNEPVKTNDLNEEIKPIELIEQKDPIEQVEQTEQLKQNDLNEQNKPNEQNED